MWNESIGKKLHTLKLYVKVTLPSDNWQNFKKKKELQFNWMGVTEINRIQGVFSSHRGFCRINFKLIFS